MAVAYEGSETQRLRAEPQKPDNWAPYCLMCDSFARMKQTEYGFYCDPQPSTFDLGQHHPVMAVGQKRGCGNKINWDLTHYQPE